MAHCQNNFKHKSENYRNRDRINTTETHVTAHFNKLR